MFGSSVFPPKYTFPPAVLSPAYGMIHGDLESVESVGGDLIAGFRCRCPSCGGTEILRVALPDHLASKLQVGKRIGIMRRGEHYIVQEASA